MELIYFPGANRAQSNHGVDLVVKSPCLSKSRIHSISYSFWDGSDPDIDSIIDEINSPNYTFDLCVGRSVGALVCLEAISRNIIRAEKLLLFGLPLNLCEEVGVSRTNLVSIIQEYPALIIQNINDPVAILGEQKNKISTKVCSFDRDDHLYVDFKAYEPFINSFIQSS